MAEELRVVCLSPNISGLSGEQVDKAGTSNRARNVRSASFFKVDIIGL